MSDRTLLEIMPYRPRIHGYTRDGKPRGYMIYIGRATAEKAGIKEKLEKSLFKLTVREEDGRLVIELREINVS